LLPVTPLRLDRQVRADERLDPGNDRHCGRVEFVLGGAGLATCYKRMSKMTAQTNFAAKKGLTSQAPVKPTKSNKGLLHAVKSRALDTFNV
jgi:hypothetical protein